MQLAANSYHRCHGLLFQVNYDYLEEDCNPYIIPATHEDELYVQLECRQLKIFQGTTLSKPIKNHDLNPVGNRAVNGYAWYSGIYIFFNEFCGQDGFGIGTHQMEAQPDVTSSSIYQTASIASMLALRFEAGLI